MTLRFEFCRLDQIGDLRLFIQENWDRNHVLVRSSDLMDWQHRDEPQQQYNFLLAIDSSSGIVGMLGFIPSSRYDAKLRGAQEVIWLTTWRVRDHLKGGVGLLLLRNLIGHFSEASVGTVGLNLKTEPIYRGLGFETGRLRRYFLLNDSLATHHLALIPSEMPTATPREGVISQFRSPSVAELYAESATLRVGWARPSKTVQYIVKRYLEHPFYDYRPHLAATDRGKGVLLISRRCVHDGRAALRIVDAIADPTALRECGPALRQLLQSSGAEYLDWYASCTDPAFEAAGLREVSDFEGLVLPGHFEPFEQTNVNLNYALSPGIGQTTISKGDADQDRPNQVAEP